MFNYAINNYKEKTVFDSTQVLKQLEITLSDNTTQTLDILAEKDIKSINHSEYIGSYARNNSK